MPTQKFTTESTVTSIIEETVGTKIIAGTNITTSYNGTTGETTINSTGGGGATNLTYTPSATNGIVVSNTGTDATIPLGNGTNAGLSLNDYTTAEKSKLAGIAAGAEVNVNADWNAVSGDAQILNKPTISGVNTGDQTSIVGITGTKAQFNTAVTDGDIMYVGDAPTAHTHTLANVTDVTMTVANLNSLDDGVNSTLHFHDSDRNRANHTGTQTASTISDFAATVRSTVLTGLSLASATVISATDTVLSAFGSLQKQITDLTTTVSGKANTSHTHTASEVTDFNSASRAQTEAELVAGANITITPSGTGATRQLTIASTGGGGGGSPGGSTGQVQYNNAGSFAGAANVEIENGSLRLDHTTMPASPAAGGHLLFNRDIAGRQMPAFIGPSGLDSALQPLLARNKIGLWMPPGNGTSVPGILGLNTFTVTGFTATARNVATTNMFTRMRRLGYVTAATAGAVGQWRVGGNQYSLGDGAGLGGFTYIVRFGISDAAAVSGARMFMGMRVDATPTNVEPSTLTNCIGIGHGAADTNLRIYYGGSAAQTPIDLGVNFPCNTRSTDVYELALFSTPNTANTVNYMVTRLNTGHVATGTLTGAATVVPQSNTLIAIHGRRTNNATALAVGLDVMSAYIETDY